MISAWLVWSIGAACVMVVLAIGASVLAGRDADAGGARTWARRSRASSLLGLAAVAAFFPAPEPLSVVLIGDNWGLAVWFGLAAAATLAGLVPLCLLVAAACLAAAHQRSSTGSAQRADGP